MLDGLPHDAFPAMIVKVGGSLLDLPDLRDRVLDLIDRNGCTRVHLIVGGGAAADLVRTWDRRFGLSADAAHQLAIRAMSLNAQLLSSLDDRLLPGGLISGDSQVSGPAVTVVDVARVLENLERQHGPLPRSWDVTSDSIAAWIANRCGIDELMLLKAAALPPDFSADVSEFPDRAARFAALQKLAAAGLIDPQFPHYAADIRNLCWCCLSNNPPSARWLWRTSRCDAANN